MSREKIDLCEGKYTVILNDKPHELKALRYGEEWRDLTGDGMILSMFFKIQELQEEVEKLKENSLVAAPYSQEDYEKAKEMGLDLDDWNDYQKYYGLGEEENYE